MSTAIDISKIPALARLVDEVAKTKKPRILKRDSEPVAMIMPMRAEERHKTIEVFDFKPVAEIITSLLHAGYSQAEVNDMLEALSELPQYADKTIREST